MELAKQGITVARRTVTKYRKAMDIPSSRKRRDWKLVRDGQPPAPVAPAGAADAADNADPSADPSGDPDGDPSDAAEHGGAASAVKHGDAAGGGESGRGAPDVGEG